MSKKKLQLRRSGRPHSRPRKGGEKSDDRPNTTHVLPDLRVLLSGGYLPEILLFYMR